MKLNAAQRLLDSLGLACELVKCDTSHPTDSIEGRRWMTGRQHHMRKRKLAARQISKKERARLDAVWAEIENGRAKHRAELAERNARRLK